MTSQLEALAAGIMGTKVEKARKLTPTAAEAASSPTAPRLPEVPGVFLAPEALRDVAIDLRRQAQLLLDVADGIDVILGVPEAVAADATKTALTEKQLAEREADRKAADREAAESGDAKAAKRVALAEAIVTADPIAELADQIKAEDKVSARALMAAVAEAQQVAIEGGATEGFAERLARLTKAAQSATFTTDTETGDDNETEAEAPESVEKEWTCPEHHARVTRTSKRGRPFGACPECNMVERLS